MRIHCKSLIHLQRSTLKAILIIKNSRKAHEWVCEFWHFKELPFLGPREFHEITGTSPRIVNSIDYENIHILNLKSHGKHLSIGHLNTQSMVSSFDEFNVMLQEHPFDILTLSETWLKDDVNLLNYVQILGYKFRYRNQNERRGGGVGLYIKDSIEYKVRHDLNKIDESIEHLWIECKGNNCNKSYPVAASTKLRWKGKTYLDRKAWHVTIYRKQHLEQDHYNNRWHEYGLPETISCT